MRHIRLWKERRLKFPFTLTRYFNCCKRTNRNIEREKKKPTKPQLTTTTILTNGKHDNLKTEFYSENKRKHHSKKIEHYKSTVYDELASKSTV